MRFANDAETSDRSSQKLDEAGRAEAVAVASGRAVFARYADRVPPVSNEAWAESDAAVALLFAKASE